MVTLAIDTSTPRGSVAVHAFGQIVFEEQFNADRSHSAALFSILERARMCAARFDQVAVGIGPGSYAGVRIAIAAAMAFELTLNSLLVGIPSILALETNASSYVAIGDARRGSYYFSHVANGECVKGPVLASETEVRGWIAEHPLVPVLATMEMEPFPTVEIVRPCAARLATLAELGRGVVQTVNLEPLYLRPPHITQAKKRSR